MDTARGVGTNSSVDIENNMVATKQRHGRWSRKNAHSDSKILSSDLNVRETSNFGENWKAKTKKARDSYEWIFCVTENSFKLEKHSKI